MASRAYLQELNHRLSDGLRRLPEEFRACHVSCRTGHDPPRAKVPSSRR